MQKYLLLTRGWTTSFSNISSAGPVSTLGIASSLVLMGLQVVHLGPAHSFISCQLLLKEEH